MWIPVTLAAALCQTLRTAAQQRMRSVLSVNGAGFVRFAFGAPLALGAVAVLVAARIELPQPGVRFWCTVAGAGVAQILATNALIRSFDLRSFAIGTVYAKTEIVQVGLFSWLLLGEPIAASAWFGVALVMAGVVALSRQPGDRPFVTIATAVRDRAAHLGVLAGGLFGLTAVAIRSSSNALGDHPAVVRALVTLAAMNTIQTLVNGVYLGVRQPHQLRLAWQHRRHAARVGVLSVLGSAGWAIAMTLENAARVRSVGQIELLFTFAVSSWWLHERHPRRDLAASAIVLTGVVIVMAS